MKIISYVGLFWLVFLLVAFFIPITVDDGGNYIVKDSLLGIMIFHNIFILIFYAIIGLVLIYLGIGKKIRIV